MVIICGRMTFSAASNNSFSATVLLDMPICTTGTLDAVYLMISGGIVPWGSERSTDCDTATTCASAVWMLTLGWKKILMIEMPPSDCDSTCSMSLTVVVSVRSWFWVIRLPICSADRPLYVQITLMTGMLMSGRASTGVRSTARGVASRMRIDITRNVYGRSSATLTIHILGRPLQNVL